jgi:glycosyltransferase involved in cell wall biosynthesis
MTGVTRRVAIVVPSLRGGGLERMAADLALGLRQHGWEPGLFPVSGLGVFAQELREAGIVVEDCRAGGLRIRGYPGRLISALHRFRPDIVHAHSGGWYPSVVARLRLGIRGLVFTDHGRYPPEPRLRAFIERQLARRTDALVCVTPALAEYVREFLRLDRAPEVIANGIDAKRYQPDPARRAELRREWGAGEQDVIFIAVGRLVEVKNHAMLIDAFARARSAAAASLLVLLGQGALEGQLRQRCRDLGLEDAVRFLGFRQDVAACLGAADVWVNSSTTEALPVSLLEAFAAGRPVIATAVGGIPEALGRPPAGLLVPSNDPTALAGAMVNLMTDEGLRVKLQQLSHERSHHYSLDRMRAEYASLYASVAARSVGRA